MPHWLIKTAAHRVISWFPRRQFWNGLLQTCITRSTTMTPDMFEKQLSECQRHFQAFRSFRPGVTGFRALEIGTGWFPTLPVGLYLCGADAISTFDIDPLVSAARLSAMLEFYLDYERRGELKKFLPEVRPERMDRLRALSSEARRENPAAVLDRINIKLRVADAQHTGLSDRSVDLIFSNGVLEYIPRPVLQGMMTECRRVAAADAVMSHRLNLVDQFSYFDSSITAFNYLRYTAAQWSWLNSPLIWQNRLRISDYKQLIREAGFEIVREEDVSGPADDLGKIELAPEFRHYSRQDLLVLHSFLVARR